MPSVSQHSLRDLALEGAADVDVTGGMAAKVRSALVWSRADPAVEVRIFSGEVAGQLQEALLGGHPGSQVAWLADPT
jgi:isopentenyl phosphate kinase